MEEVERRAALLGAGARRRELVRAAEANYGISERKTCQVLGCPRSSQRYQARRDEQAALRMRLKELAAARVRYGYRRLHILLRRESMSPESKVLPLVTQIVSQIVSPRRRIQAAGAATFFARSCNH